MAGRDFHIAYTVKEIMIKAIQFSQYLYFNPFAVPHILTIVEIQGGTPSFKTAVYRSLERDQSYRLPYLF